MTNYNVFYVDEVRLCLRTADSNGLIVLPPDNIYEYGALIEWYRQGKAKNSEKKTRPGAKMSTTNPKWTDPGANTVLREGGADE
jgi:hypothetical protein